MKLPVDQYTDEEIQKRLDFAAHLENVSGKKLPAHLQAEKDELVAEQNRRKAPTQAGRFPCNES